MQLSLPEIIVIGSGVVDIPLSPVGPEIFENGSTPLERIAMGVGGDAVNESIILSRLGHPAALVSKVGQDAPGDFLLQKLREAGVDTGCVVREPGLDTGINIVLVRPDGERGFVTNRNGSLRRLGLSDILPALDAPLLRNARIACLASLFVSPMLTLADTVTLFDALKARGLALCADTTRPKHGETLREAGPALSRLDYFFPNLEEASALTGESAPDAVADALLDSGVGCVAIKLGREGCLLASRAERRLVPAVPGIVPADTTGAGDTFAAAFQAALLEKRSLLDCARFACAAASLCVERVGAISGDWNRNDVLDRCGQ